MDRCTAWSIKLSIRKLPVPLESAGTVPGGRSRASCSFRAIRCAPFASRRDGTPKQPWWITLPHTVVTRLCSGTGRTGSRFVNPATTGRLGPKTATRNTVTDAPQGRSKSPGAFRLETGAPLKTNFSEIQKGGYPDRGVFRRIVYQKSCKSKALRADDTASECFSFCKKVY